jgi:phosphoglycolate phosphatase
VNPTPTDVTAVGFDLDLTLADTRAASAIAFAAVNDRFGSSIDIDECVRNIGPPVGEQMAAWLLPEDVEPAVQEYRAAFLRDGLRHLCPLPGAAEALSGVRDMGYRAVVITSRMDAVAAAVLTACGLVPDAVVGGVTGLGKAPAMRLHHVHAYVGDHTLDMVGAAHAGVRAVGVLTGSHTRQELTEAGADWVLDSLVQTEPLMMALAVDWQHES